MKLRSHQGLWLGLVPASLAATVAAVAFVGSGGTSEPAPAAAAPAPSAARTSFPGLAPAVGEPQLGSMQTARPARGQVLQVRGPFDDRFVLESTIVDGSAVTGTVRVTSDVSDVLELQVLAGFHDKQGSLLGTGRFVHHFGDHGHAQAGLPQERTRFTIPVPEALAHRAVSVTIGVPVLVNE